MIELLPTTALMLYLFLTLTTLVGIWGWHHLAQRKKKVILEKDELIVCEYCSFAYLADRSAPVSSCPQCDSYNKS